MESKLVSIRSKIGVDIIDEMRQQNIYKNKIMPSRKMQNEEITKFDEIKWNLLYLTENSQGYLFYLGLSGEAEWT